MTILLKIQFTSICYFYKGKVVLSSSMSWIIQVKNNKKKTPRKLLPLLGHLEMTETCKEGRNLVVTPYALWRVSWVVSWLIRLALLLTLVMNCPGSCQPGTSEPLIQRNGSESWPCSSVWVLLAIYFGNWWLASCQDGYIWGPQVISKPRKVMSWSGSVERNGVW